MPEIKTRLGNIFYADHQKGADGPPVILLHGAGASHLVWAADFRRLPGRRVIAPDLPAHGRSSAAAPLNLETYAAAILGLLDALKLPSVVLAGHSMGGALAQVLALQQPARVAGLVLIGTGAHLPVNPLILAELRQQQPKIAALLNQWSWSRNADPGLKAQSLAVLEAVPPEVLYADYAACSSFDVRAQLPQLDVPSLVLVGTEDKMTPPALSEALAAGLPQARLHLIPGGGHNVMMEQAAPVAEVIRQWINRC